MIIDKSLKCPWNKFKKCWEHLCPYYGLIEKREKEAGKFDIINGCKRVSKEKEAQKVKLNNECPICGKCSMSPSNQYCREHEILNCNTYDKKYIEREAAVKAAKDGADEWDGGYNRNRDSYIECAIDNIPTADVRENVRGEWLINCDGYYPYCSHCKEEPQGHAMTDYCPNCGAQMKR